MKKLFYSMAVAAMALGMTACGGNKSEATDSAADSLEVLSDTAISVMGNDSVVEVTEEVETVVEDANAVAAEAKTAGKKAVEAAKTTAKQKVDAAKNTAKEKTEEVKAETKSKAEKLLKKSEDAVKAGVSDAKEKAAEKLNKL
ncbi:MAG: hypothetical protein K2N03_01405 [Muribaculaceae bacterium]|nr:hypothetical protein [Muribaculaceae bacterium]